MRSAIRFSIFEDNKFKLTEVLHMKFLLDETSASFIIENKWSSNYKNIQVYTQSRILRKRRRKPKYVCVNNVAFSGRRQRYSLVHCRRSRRVHNLSASSCCASATKPSECEINFGRRRRHEWRANVHSRCTVCISIIVYIRGVSGRNI